MSGDDHNNTTPKYAPGGIVSGPGTVRVERAPDCSRGHLLWRIEGGAPEHVISRTDPAAELIACQRELEARGEVAS